MTRLRKNLVAFTICFFGLLSLSTSLPQESVTSDLPFFNSFTAEARTLNSPRFKFNQEKQSTTRERENEQTRSPVPNLMTRKNYIEPRNTHKIAGNIRTTSAESQDTGPVESKTVKPKTSSHQIIWYGRAGYETEPIFPERTVPTMNSRELMKLHSGAAAKWQTPSFLENVILTEPQFEQLPLQQKENNVINSALFEKEEKITNEESVKEGPSSGHTTPGFNLVVVASANTALAIICLLFNGIIVLYYWNNSTNLPSTLYFRNGLCDGMTAVGILLQTPSLLSILDQDASHTLPLVSYLVTTVAARMGVFMNCVLGSVRCIKIISPFYFPNRKLVSASTLLYAILWTVTASLDLWLYITQIGLQNKVYLVKSLVLKAEPGFSITSLAGSQGASVTSLSQGEVVLTQFLIPVAVPAVACFILMIIQVYHLTGQKISPASTQTIWTGQRVKLPEETRCDKMKRAGKTRNRKAAITILIVTAIYVITSLATVAVWLVIYRGHLGKEKEIKRLSWTELSVIYFSGSTLPLLCSTLTPLTLFVRSSAMQIFLGNSYRDNFVKSFVGGKKVGPATKESKV